MNTDPVEKLTRHELSMAVRRDTIATQIRKYEQGNSPELYGFPTSKESHEAIITELLFDNLYAMDAWQELFSALTQEQVVLYFALTAPGRKVEFKVAKETS